MGWGIYFKPEVAVKENHHNKHTVEAKIEDLTDELREREADFLAMAVADFEKLYPKSEEPFQDLRFEVRDMLRDLNEITIDLFKHQLLLMYLQDNPDKKISNLT